MGLLKIAVQKSGRLNEKSMEMLKECGIRTNHGSNQLKASALNFPCELLFLRDDDIPAYVEDGVADVGFVGENVFIESGSNTQIVERLGFAKCRLAIAVKRETVFKDFEQLNGMKIATTYPRILQAFLDKNNLKCEIHYISGSVEIAPSIGLADAICDIVSTGSTLLSNGLKEVATVMFSEAVLIGNSNLSRDKAEILNRLLFRIRAYNKAQNYKYILLNAPNEKLEDIINIIPGMKSPTIMPLSTPGWSSVHSVINEDEFWAVIENLQANGAQGILVAPIEKMIL
jgi:ATP phosphoribosyltransferase